MALFRLVHEGCTCTHVQILKKYKKHLNTRTQSAHMKGDQERPGIWSLHRCERYQVLDCDAYS